MHLRPDEREDLSFQKLYRFPSAVGRSGEEKNGWEKERKEKKAKTIKKKKQISQNFLEFWDYQSIKIYVEMLKISVY